MKFKQSVFALSIAALLVAAPLHAGRQGPDQAGTVAQEVVSESLSGDETAGLVFMREEEKLARDVYLTLYDLWQHPVFSSISQAEQKHMDTMGALVDNYGLDDPVADDSVGVFTNPELDNLYDELVSQGQESLLDALYAGAYIEEIDIQDLEEAIAASTHPDLIQAYENLQRGSRNHLRAFVRQIEMLGEPYESWGELDELEVDAILDSNLERGRPRGNGRRGR